MIAGLFAAVVVGGVALPHALQLDRCEPMSAVILWVSSLALRALTALFLAAWLVFFLPATALFNAVTHWCWHAVVPLVTTHLGFSGHNVADVATVAPSFVLAASALSVSYGVARAARSVHRLLNRDSIGPGPRGSVIVGSGEVVLAAAGLHRPKLVVSAGALVLLDDEELDAGLEHERGHIQRRHRFILVFAELCRSLGRFLPGARTAITELNFHLERDADAWALARRHDRYALASAICKAALSRHPTTVYAAVSGGGNRLADRVQAIVHEPSSTPPRTAGIVRLLAAGSASVALAFTLVLPATVALGNARWGSAQPVHHCPR
jgi:hypothetical protein